MPSSEKHARKDKHKQEEGDWRVKTLDEIRQEKKKKKEEEEKKSRESSKEMEAGERRQRRHSSGDERLDDDEDDMLNIQPPQAKTSSHRDPKHRKEEKRKHSRSHSRDHDRKRRKRSRSADKSKSRSKDSERDRERERDRDKGRERDSRDSRDRMKKTRKDGHDDGRQAGGLMGRGHHEDTRHVLSGGTVVPQEDLRQTILERRDQVVSGDKYQRDVDRRGRDGKREGERTEKPKEHSSERPRREERHRDRERERREKEEKRERSKGSSRHEGHKSRSRSRREELTEEKRDGQRPSSKERISGGSRHDDSHRDSKHRKGLEEHHSSSRERSPHRSSREEKLKREERRRGEGRDSDHDSEYRRSKSSSKSSSRSGERDEEAQREMDTRKEMMADEEEEEEEEEEEHEHEHEQEHEVQDQRKEEQGESEENASSSSEEEEESEEEESSEAESDSDEEEEEEGEEKEEQASSSEEEEEEEEEEEVEESSEEGEASEKDDSEMEEGEHKDSEEEEEEEEVEEEEESGEEKSESDDSESASESGSEEESEKSGEEGVGLPEEKVEVTKVKEEKPEDIREVYAKQAKSKFDDSPSPLGGGTFKVEETSDMLSDTEYLQDSPPASPIELEEKLPPYFPAIQGCRNVEEFQCLNRIAEGTYGVVYRAKEKKKNEIVALKRLKMEKEKEGFPITSLREISTLLKAQHRNIVTVREIVVGSNMDKIYIVMDYVEHDLKSLMETMKQPFTIGETKCLMLQLLRGVHHLHDNWILHRDLKTSNLLLNHQGCLKIGDFGLAREYGSPIKPYTSIVVTLWYRAPELLLGTKVYSTPIDMWSVGCIFAEFLTMKPIFNGRSEIDQLNRIFKELGTPSEKIWPGYNELPAVKKTTFATHPYNNLRGRFGTYLTDMGFELLNRFLTYDPVRRITAEDALKSSYFNESPQPISESMFPTWPAKSENARTNKPRSPQAPEGGQQFAKLEREEEDSGFHMSLPTHGSSAQTTGFSLKF